MEWFCDRKFRLL